MNEYKITESFPFSLNKNLINSMKEKIFKEGNSKTIYIEPFNSTLYLRLQKNQKIYLVEIIIH